MNLLQFFALVGAFLLTAILLPLFFLLLIGLCLYSLCSGGSFLNSKHCAGDCW